MKKTTWIPSLYFLKPKQYNFTWLHGGSLSYGL